jgi:hypothetical protein
MELHPSTFNSSIQKPWTNSKIAKHRWSNHGFLEQNMWKYEIITYVIGPQTHNVFD